MIETHLLQEGDSISMVVDGYKARTTKDAEYLKTLHADRFVDTGILPPVVRWMSKSRRIVLFERPPCIMRVGYSHAKLYDINEQTKENVFEIPIPWQLYAIELGQDYYPVHVAVYAMQHSLKSWQDKLGLMPLPNLYKSGFVCMPQRDFAKDDVATNVAEGIAIAHRLVWQSGFNTDLIDAMQYCKSYLVPKLIFEGFENQVTAKKVYAQWEKLSLAQVAKIDSWLHPPAYGPGPFVEENQATETAATLVNKLARVESARGDDNTLHNMQVRIQQAMTRA